MTGLQQLLVDQAAHRRAGAKPADFPSLVRRRRSRARRRVGLVAGLVALLVVGVLAVPRDHPVDRTSAAALTRATWTTGALIPGAAPQGEYGVRLSLTWTGKEVLALSYDGTRSAAWNPRTKRWRSIAGPPGDGARVWLGSRLLVLEAGAGELYDPVRDTTSPTAPLPVGVEPSFEAVRDGSTAVVLGSYHRRFVAYRYDPAGNTWTDLRPPQPPGETAHVAATGTYAAVTSSTLTGARRTVYSTTYRLRSSAWQLISPPRASGRLVLEATQAGPRRVITTTTNQSCGVAYVDCEGGRATDPVPLHLVDPETGAVQDLPAPCDGQPTVFWTGAAVLALDVFGLDAGVCVLDGRAWREVARPPEQLATTPVWTGTSLFTVGQDGRALTLRR